MAKEKLKYNTNPVGATSNRPYFEGITKKQNGITLIALIITIIVMLILVGVSVTVAINGGLFIKVKDASNRTEQEMEKEVALLDGPIEIDDKKYASFDDYLNDKEIIELPEGWTETETPPEWTKVDGTINDKVTAIIDENNNKVPLPKGYSISKEANIVSEGLVITDGENEFVWIPVPKETVFGASYTSGDYSEPKYLKFNDSNTKLSYDSQATIDYYYGYKDENSYYTIDINSAGTNDLATNTTVSNGTTFDYGHHYNEMVTSVNKYNGFYIGRYETTISENKIGSKEGATILSTNQSIEQANNKECRWWGIYYVQRNSNVKGNGSIVQTNMIWGRQWEAMIEYFTREGKVYTETEVKTLATTKKQNAGQAKYTYSNETISDEICNIYDLRGNVRDWTAEASDTNYRVYRGGDLGNRLSASSRSYCSPDVSYGLYGSRLTLYIK